MIGLAIYDLLSSAVNVAALVSTRIYPDMATQGAVYPFIVYSVTGTQPTDTKEGVSELDVVQVSVICYANTYTTAQDLAEKSRVALDRASGTHGTLDVQSIRFEDQQSATMNLDKQVYIVEQSYAVRLKR